MRSRGVDPLAYVELVGIVAQANCVDRFADGLELPRLALGEPVDGPPSRADRGAHPRFPLVDAAAA
ncbi:hypothetical protein [Candidatus Poriferisodalis sp.]|uniref:hypothetical protein n=1 Tax=Candidatus Poriferisodalis sp. TaxID=3101277 RepID=UPI003B028787